MLNELKPRSTQNRANIYHSFIHNSQNMEYYSVRKRNCAMKKHGGILKATNLKGYILYDSNYMTF